MTDSAVQAYCVKCKTKRTMKDVKKTTITTKTGSKRPVAKGVCPNCGTKMVRFLKA